ncbi:hypothetical protein TNCV_205311 [Trichonephila clavipes]|nr:hypothetical protein TNCV_205311 [Trichonephila clavipes]
MEHHKITALLGNVVSDFGYIPRCTTIDSPIHSSHVNIPLHTPKITPSSTPKSTTKRKDCEFQAPLSRETARRVLLETPHYMDLNLENLFSFPSFNKIEFTTLHTTT